MLETMAREKFNSPAHDGRQVPAAAHSRRLRLRPSAVADGLARDRVAALASGNAPDPLLSSSAFF
jgi:hypothetical protein